MRRILSALALLALAVPAAAGADATDVIRDCTRNGTLTKQYTQDDYAEALSDLPADVDEYGDCREIIREAQLAAASGRAGGRGAGAGAAGAGAAGSGATAGPILGAAGPAGLQPRTAQERRAVAEAQRHPASPVRVGGESVIPGGTPTASATGGAAAAVDTLPASLILVVAVVALLVALAAVLTGRRLVRLGRDRDPA
ncbi:MAG TPA: hypothetical protein VK279_09040 [Solirubrobacteraceae bacterium]|nr:hypothetical protein [Solirubrobacteraceae bacterium]